MSILQYDNQMDVKSIVDSSTIDYFIGNDGRVCGRVVRTLLFCSEVQGLPRVMM